MTIPQWFTTVAISERARRRVNSFKPLVNLHLAGGVVHAMHKKELLMAAHADNKMILHATPAGDALITLEQERDVVLEATVDKGRTEAIDGPDLQVDWAPLRAVMDIIINALGHAGIVPREVLQTRERYVRGRAGMNLLLELRTTEPIDATAHAAASELVEFTLGVMMQKPSARAGEQIPLTNPTARFAEACMSIERDLDRVGGRNLKAPVNGRIAGKAPVTLTGALGRKRDQSDFNPTYTTIEGTVRGFINESERRCLLMRPLEGGVVEVDFAENQIDTMLNLEEVLRLNKSQARCAVKVTLTKGSRGQSVYGYAGLKAVPLPETLLGTE